MESTEKMDWQEFERNGGTWEEFIDDVMHEFMGDVWDEINREAVK